MRFNRVPRRVASGRKAHLQSVASLIRSKGPLQQCLLHGPKDAGANTKQQENICDSDIWNGEDAIAETVDGSRMNLPFSGRPFFVHGSWEQWSKSYDLRTALGILIREQTSPEIYSALRERTEMSDSQRARRGVKTQFEDLASVHADLEKSRHVVRLLYAYYQWRRQRPLDSRKNENLRSALAKLRIVRAALDGNQILPNATADTIFLFKNGFAEILKRDAPRVGTINDRRSRLRCVEVLTELITEINNELTLDIDAVILAHILPKCTTLTPGSASEPIVSEPTQTPPVTATVSQDLKANELQRKSNVSSPEDRATILSKLSPALQLRIKNGILVDQVAFPRDIPLEQPWPGLWESLTSLIEDQLGRPKKKGESQELYQARRQSLLANAEWIRSQRSKGLSRSRLKRQEREMRAKLHVLTRWRDYHKSRLKVYQQTPHASVGAKRRITQVQAVIEETTGSIQHLQSAIAAGQSEHDDESHPTGSATHDSTQASHEVKTSVQLKPASLPDSLLYHLSRELLDSLNEAAFAFGQREAPAMMQRNYWNTPETIDLPIFVSSFSLYPNLFHRFVNYEKVFSRLRSFRNHYAHGSGSMTAGDISLALDDVTAVARLLQSSELTAKVNDYRILLTEFSTNQTEHTKRAYSIVRKCQAKSKAKLEKTKTGAKGDKAASEDAMMELMASQAAMIKEAWKHVEKSLLERNARKISLFVAEAQIRRILEKMGSDATTVLSQIQEERRSSSTEAAHDPEAKEIIDLLKHKLSQALVENTSEQPTEAGNAVTSSDIGADVVTPELLELLPSARKARNEKQARQQKEQLRQLARMVRKGI